MGCDASIIDFVLRRAQDTADVRVYPMAAITQDLGGEKMTEFGLLKEAGAVAVTDGIHSVQNSRVLSRAMKYAGNFGLLPNGVFCIRDGRADVFETLSYVDQAPQCRFATQSGPMLVIDGELHPRFRKTLSPRSRMSGA